MNDLITFDLHCLDAESTEAFGQRFGKVLKGGEVIELVGDIGAGKTTFVRGLAKGLDSTNHVSSPTFTVSQIYGGRLSLHHLDLYRLDEPGIVSSQLSEILDEPNSVVVVEWGGGVAEVLPFERIKITFKVAAAEARKLRVSAPKSMGYIQC